METKTTYKLAEKKKEYVSTRNACKLCSPLGACVVFKGIRGCIPLIHGSQGCATYIRRYMISHYKEPVDIASSNFSEETTIFGGNKNFNTSIDNIVMQYQPEVIGIASTCLSETIGEDVGKLMYEYSAIHAGKDTPVLVNASTPSYQGTHIDGFHEAVASVISHIAEEGEKKEHINIFPGFVSPEDIRHLKDILDDFGLEHILFPDYSESLDNPNWEKYTRISSGGTPVADIKRTGSAKASIDFGYVLNKVTRGNIRTNNKQRTTGAEFLEAKFGVPRYNLGLPIGIKDTDRFFNVLKELSGREVPKRHQMQRGRLIDAYVDGHKYLFGKRAIVYGEEDLVIGLVSFLEEIGIHTVLAGSGGESGRLKEELKLVTSGLHAETIVKEGLDFEEMKELIPELKPDLMIGNSKGYYLAREFGIPLVRVGFPIHDRVGAQRVQTLGYNGTQQLFDRVTNAILEYKQNNSPVGYKYM